MSLRVGTAGSAVWDHQVMTADALAPRYAQASDIAALVGLLAVLEGEVWGGGETDDIPDWAEPLSRRLARDGLLTEQAGQRELRQALNDLNHRLRYVLGEYDEPPTPVPLP
jgi:hypothetical protein